MAEQFGPFSSGAGASVSEDFWNIFAQSFARSGVIAGYLSELQVNAGVGLNVNLSSGAAWVVAQGYKNDNTKSIPVNSNNSGNPRIDRLVLRRDLTGKSITPQIVQGTPAGSPQPPALTRNSSIYEISLAQVRVNNGAGTVIVTDERGDIRVCGWTYGGPVPDFPILRSTANVTLTTSPQDVPGCSLSNIPPGRWLITGVFDFSIEGAGDNLSVGIGGCYSDVGIIGQLDGSAALGGPTGTRGTVCEQWDLEVPTGTVGNIKLQVNKSGGTGTSRCILKNTTLKVQWSPK